MTSTTDLVGGPFAVIESDPGVFTSLTRRLGIRRLELVELYDIEPWAVDHLSPYGLIFCFMWRKDTHRPTDFNDPAAERVWFANQLSDDACATHAILNVLLNCPSIDIGDELRAFRKETEHMSPVMRGLAITNSPLIRPAHNSFARPSDIRSSLSSIATATLDAIKRKEKQRKEEAAAAKPPPAKRAKLTKAPTKRKPKPKGKKKAADTETEEDTYHFIGYVPAHGKVWELDGLKSGPLEVGELPTPPTHTYHTRSSSSSSTQPIDPESTHGWMDIARPALRMKMDKYGGSGSDNSNIRFSLLAIVDDGYMTASDELELLKRERATIERRLEMGWDARVDQALLSAALTAFELPHSGRTYAPDFGARKMERDMEIMKLGPEELLAAWEECVRKAVAAKVGVEDEYSKGVRANTDHVKRTFDYEPFIREYLRSLQEAGLLNPLLDRDSDGKKRRGRKAVAAKS
ncbi:cysteine proteinase [Pholiota conissans]|uniref:ubiquitinyl hydrolase 1 n=1 Tax=Pholiota conissans TaxID=109636 RepID=A0A9P5YMX9_9AGAR|nr:cysteine proteinase [Pholiota conissans]